MKLTPALRAAQRGMTLIEIMVVLVIIGLIAGAVAVNVVGMGEKARVDLAQKDIRTISDQMDAFKLMRGRYPSTEEGIPLLIQEKFLKANSKDGKMVDPWKREYIYLYPGQANANGFDVKSYGADGQPGGTGDAEDIVNF